MRLRTLSAVLLVSSVAVPLGAQIDNPDPVMTIVDWHGRDVVEGEVMVQFIPGTPASAQRDLHRDLGTTVMKNITAELCKIEVPAGRTLDEVIADYEVHQDVRLVEPNFVVYPIHVPNDDDWGSQYGPQQIECPTAWDTYRGGNAAVTVSVIDTGVRTTHNDLDANYAFGYDYFAGDSNPNDQNGHGTHCAGIAAAETNNDFGIAGVGYEQNYAGYRCGNGSFAGDVLVEAVNDSVSKGAHVLSMSFGGPGRIGILAIALEDSYQAGLVNVAAAGNESNTREFWPAAEHNVLSVAATNSSENRAGFSTYGDWVSVAAPGESIYSTWRGSDTDFASVSGTSMACPHVAGMAAFLYSRLGGVRSKANSNRVRDLIQSTSRDKDFVKYGLVDLAAALEALDNGEGDTEFGEPPGQCTRPTRYGSGTAGTGGLVPVITQDDFAYLGNQDWEAIVVDGLANTSGVLFVGFSSANDSTGGYTRLVEPIFTGAFNTDGNGEASFALGIPNNPFIDGFDIFLQAVLTDAGAGSGLSASQGFLIKLCSAKD